MDIIAHLIYAKITPKCGKLSLANNINKLGYMFKIGINFYADFPAKLFRIPGNRNNMADKNESESCQVKLQITCHNRNYFAAEAE